MHQVTGRWRLGCALALVTAFCWGILPIALKVMLQEMDAFTITWYRVATATVVLGSILAARRSLPSLGGLTRRSWGLMVVALLGLVGNWVLYVAALQHTTPAMNQTVVQLSPLFLLLGGVLIYKEHFSTFQWIGFASLIGGLLLFFNRRLPELVHVGSGLGLGVVMLVSASLMWAAYALAQKSLLKRMTSPQIVWLMYLGGALLLIWFAHPAQVGRLDARHVWLLVFCCVNTLVGYGAFAEALDHWEVSRISAVIALAPIFTFTGMQVTARLAPGWLAPERFTAPTLTGALIVVAGSALSAFGQKRSDESDPGV